jgi:hypothetical protein
MYVCVYVRTRRRAWQELMQTRSNYSAIYIYIYIYIYICIYVYIYTHTHTRMLKHDHSRTQDMQSGGRAWVECIVYRSACV